MSRSFLTGLNLNKNELLNARIQNLANPPSNPVTGQIYYDTDTNQVNVWDGTAWAALAAGGNVSDQIQAAIDALTTDDIEEGSTNLYYTESRAKDDAAELLTGATLTNITITGTGSGLTITAENGVADSDTDDLTEGTTNLYYTDARVDSHLSGGDGISYSTGTISVDLTTGGGLGITLGQLGVDRTTVDTWYDEAGAAAAAETAANGYTDTAIGALTTNDIEEGLALYFTDERAQDAVGNSVGTGLSYNDTTGAISVDTSTIATKTYVDGLVQGLSVKDSVRAASAVAGTLASDFDNGSTVGGVTIATNDRILIKNQVDAGENGIYIVNASGAPTRAADADPVASELEVGTYVLVTEGTYAATGWLVTSYALGATTWTQFSAANEYSAGNGIAIASNVISADLDGAASGLSLGEGGLSVNVSGAGGLEKDPLTGALQINLGTGLAVNLSNELTFASGYGVQKYAAQNALLEPTSNVVTWVVTHSIGSRDVEVQVYELSGYTQVEVDVVRTNTAAVTLSWVATANVAADSYRVVVLG